MKSSNIILNAENVKVGDVLYVVPTDTRVKPWHFTVGKIGRKYIFNTYGNSKFEIGTNEIYRKDGIGSAQYVYLNEEEYIKERNRKQLRREIMNNIIQYYSMLTDEEAIVINEMVNKAKERFTNEE